MSEHKKAAELQVEVERLRSDLAQAEEREQALGAAFDAVVAERDALLRERAGVEKIRREVATGLIQSVPKT